MAIEKITFADSVYAGSFENGQPHGKGKKTCADGGVYEGDFSEGEFHGKGKMHTQAAHFTTVIGLTAYPTAEGKFRARTV